jgi:hypothetical protein
MEVAMKGTVTAYSAAVHGGVLESTDGKTHYFSRSEWKSKIAPAKGIQVEFSSTPFAIRDITALQKKRLQAK